MPKPELPAWQLLASRPLLSHPFVQLVEDTVRLESGRETTWWRFADDGRDTVCVTAVDAAGRMLVSYQYNHAPGRVVDEFPGGGVEPGEEYRDAAPRELLEETGLWAAHLTEIGAFSCTTAAAGGTAGSLWQPGSSRTRRRLTRRNSPLVSG
jgi:hypothetical protein